jgi:ABC-type Fe3+ transport system substrate-binding protein
MDRSRGALALAVAVLLAAAPVSAATQDEIANLSGPDREKVLLEGAKKEGEVTWYTTLIVDQVAQGFEADFKKKYPDIKLNMVRLSSGPLVQRVLAESRAKNIHGDVIVANGIAALKNTGIGQAFTTPYNAAYPKDYIDKDRTWMAFYSLWEGIAWNTKTVPDAEAPKTWEALLNPKWKGKMAWGESIQTGPVLLVTQLRKQWGEERTLDYFKKLKEQDVRMMSGSIRAVLDQVIAGEFPIGINMAMHHIAISQSQGAPIAGISPEPSLAQNGYVMMIKGAPHPYAAALLTDYLMSPDGGQRILRDVQYNPAHPKVEPRPELRWIQPNLNGKSETVISPEEQEGMTDKSAEIFKSIFR